MSSLESHSIADVIVQWKFCGYFLQLQSSEWFLWNSTVIVCNGRLSLLVCVRIMLSFVHLCRGKSNTDVIWAGLVHSHLSLGDISGPYFIPIFREHEFFIQQVKGYNKWRILWKIVISLISNSSIEQRRCRVLL